MLQRLHHPHIRAYYGSGEENGLCYLALEYLEGQLLAKRLEQGPLPVDEALEYARQIADALSSLCLNPAIHAATGSSSKR